MKPAKFIVIGILLAFGAFCAAVSSSCSKDSCKTVTCLNGGTCGGGTCNCLKKGTGGVNCEIIYRDQYANSYIGSGYDDSGIAYVNNTMVFNVGVDSDYTRMQIVWNNPGVRSVTLPVTLSHFSSSGSDITVTPTTKDTFSYTGSGFVSSTAASLTLTETHPNSTPVQITLHSFSRQ